MIPLFRSHIPTNAMIDIENCLNRGWLGYGTACQTLEGCFTNHHGGGFALATSSCTSALHLAAMAFKHSPQDEVIVPAITFISTAMAFSVAGYRVCLADVDPIDLLPTEKTILRCASENTRAVVAVHLYGRKTPLAGLRRLCDQRGWALIEDCAHRLDLLDDAPPIGDCTCYSFNAVKEAPAGEGGLLWCRDENTAQTAREVSNLGLVTDTINRISSPKHDKYEYGPCQGLKMRLNDLSASLALTSIGVLPTVRSRLCEIQRKYEEAFAPFIPFVTPLRRSHGDSFLMNVVKLQGVDREALRERLAIYRVATSVHYPSLSKHPIYADQQCPVAENCAENIMTLPCFPDISAEQQTHVIEALSNAISQELHHFRRGDG